MISRTHLAVGDVLEAVRGYVRALSNPGDEWLDHWWTLYDVAWTAEAAVIYSCPLEIDSITTPPVEGSNVENAASVGSEDSIKPNQMLDVIFAAQNSTPNQPRHSDLVRSLTAALLNEYDVSSFTRDIVPFAKISESIISCFTEFLQNRARRLTDCNGQIRGLLDRLRLEVESWCRNASSLTGGDTDFIGQQYFPLFIVDCPKQHPIPSVTLKDKHLPSQLRDFLVQVCYISDKHFIIMSCQPVLLC